MGPPLIASDGSEPLGSVAAGGLDAVCGVCGPGPVAAVASSASIGAADPAGRLRLGNSSSSSAKREDGVLWMSLDMPQWVAEPLAIEDFVRHCHTQKCTDFQKGHCQWHKPMLCFHYHFEGQRRRPPVGPDGRLKYWDVSCEWLAHPSQCSRGDECPLAHSKDEISYHPAKYKTRMCNGKDCRSNICCFAHYPRELRSAAPGLYSQASHVAAAGRPHSDAATAVQTILASTQTSGRPPDDCTQFDLQTFKVSPCTRGRNAPHDRKLCVFYHNLRDRRRPPDGYIAEPCGECFDVDLPQPSRCPRGDKCDRCHNRLELLYHPEVFKQRFCATYPDVSACQRGSFCAFAHSREEIGSRLFDPEEERAPAISDDFYMYRFKTLWCPYGIQHDWHRCVYAHTYQDWRRSPKLLYGSEPCPHWVKNVAYSEYLQRCPNGFHCQYAHGSKEQLYHPMYYKTMPCTDWTGNQRCPRRALCAFFHSTSERRKVSPQKFDYSAPLANFDVLRLCQPGFQKPPLFGLDEDAPLAGLHAGAGSLTEGGEVPAGRVVGGYRDASAILAGSKDSRSTKEGVRSSKRGGRRMREKPQHGDKKAGAGGLDQEKKGAGHEEGNATQEANTAAAASAAAAMWATYMMAATSPQALAAYQHHILAHQGLHAFDFCDPYSLGALQQYNHGLGPYPGQGLDHENEDTGLGGLDSSAWLGGGLGASLVAPVAGLEAIAQEEDDAFASGSGLFEAGGNGLGLLGGHMGSHGLPTAYDSGHSTMTCGYGGGSARSSRTSLRSVSTTAPASPAMQPQHTHLTPHEGSFFAYPFFSGAHPPAGVSAPSLRRTFLGVGGGHEGLGELASSRAAQHQIAASSEPTAGSSRLSRAGPAYVTPEGLLTMSSRNSSS